MPPEFGLMVINSSGVSTFCKRPVIRANEFQSASSAPFFVDSVFSALSGDILLCFLESFSPTSLRTIQIFGTSTVVNKILSISYICSSLSLMQSSNSSIYEQIQHSVYLTLLLGYSVALKVVSHNKKRRVCKKFWRAIKSAIILAFICQSTTDSFFSMILISGVCYEAFFFMKQVISWPVSSGQITSERILIRVLKQSWCLRQAIFMN